MEQQKTVDNIQLTVQELNIIRMILEDYHDAGYTKGKADVENLEKIMTKLGCEFESQLA